ncbi:hypothetical protein CBM2592_B40030 [Cupriavidus taiwanensis]|nr:hypothetical protein CBM2592_B40030 [Cupriavidus taiwanensis]SOY70508.1 hypothetical protein CBM2588_B30030 [Cupriavidus taiwanensis]SOY95460.1 hypothetical protein CBM2591_B20031 [Cupriavidus taiwanensis]SOZ74253.1 hypothetical protein CBM2617_B50031 [Cupriavidus taiwanensis]SOZ88068.1 hypothetical protein CBM2618_B40032 [Cupriavidus taiwanensis]
MLPGEAGSAGWSGGGCAALPCSDSTIGRGGVALYPARADCDVGSVLQRGVCITLRADRTNWFADRLVGLTAGDGQV